MFHASGLSAKVAESTRNFANDKHNDHAAKIILVAYDGEKFRVHQWYMAQKSDFIADLLATASGGSLDDSHILTEVFPEAMRIHVNLIYIDTIPAIRHFVPHTADIISLYYRFLSPSVKDLLIQAVHSQLASHAWLGFLFAAQSHNIPLARESLSLMSEEFSSGAISTVEIEMMGEAGLRACCMDE